MEWNRLVMLLALGAYGCQPAIAGSCARKCEADRTCSGAVVVEECQRSCEDEADQYAQAGCGSEFQAVVECWADASDVCHPHRDCGEERARGYDCLVRAEP